MQAPENHLEPTKKAFGAYHKAPKMYEPKESRSTCLSLDFGDCFFLLLQESSLLADLSCCAPVMHTCSPGWRAWLPICSAVDFFRKVARLSCSSGNCQLLPSWKSRTELLLVSGGVGKWYTRNMAQITAVFNASLLTELERNLFPLPRLFSEAEEVAEMSRDNVVISGQN